MCLIACLKLLNYFRLRYIALVPAIRQPTTLAVATNASSVHGTFTAVKASVGTWMGDHQEIPGAVNLGPFVGVDLNL